MIGVTARENLKKLLRRLRSAIINGARDKENGNTAVTSFNQEARKS